MVNAEILALYCDFLCEGSKWTDVTLKLNHTFDVKLVIDFWRKYKVEPYDMPKVIKW